MSRKTVCKGAIFQPIRGASEITGLSQKFIRDGCKNNRIPHVMCGSDFRINMPMLLAQLDRESEGNKDN